ncbi:hypothetical protein [Haliscomenobacter sp.]|uniref:hypothetical protein n=1 Tax=Haliscomenobacter sp. TaxID=2717303 RepID=UPI00359461D8
MKHHLIYLVIILSLFIPSCKNQECDYIQEVSRASKDYIETSDSTAFKGQKTLVFDEENIQMKYNYSFCKTSAKGAWSCRSVLTIQNLTDREVRIYFYRSEANQMAKQSLMTVITCAPQGISKGLALNFISFFGCTDLDNLFPLIRVSYQ